MTSEDRVVDDQLASAAHELRSQVDLLQPGDFRPNRSALPAVVLLVLLLGAGAFGLLAFDRSEPSGAVSVATQPEDPPAPTVVSAAVRRLTAAEPGDYFMPIPGNSAWNSDETMILLYRTGSASSHVIIDANDPAAEPQAIDVSPQDIEQVYWHPQRPNEMVYMEDAAIVSFDTTTGTTSTIYEFEDCGRVGSGALPVPPTADGTLSLLCISESQQQLVIFDLSSNTERVRSEPLALDAADTAAVPSPSGMQLLLWQPDGSVAVLDRNLTPTGVVLDIASNRFAFLTDSNGREWVVSTLFDGDWIGSAVLLPLDGASDPIVAIGPDRGDIYPPSGNLVSAAGSRVVLSTRGPDDGAIAGRVTVLDFAASLANPTRTSRPHESTGRVEYWSNPFVALSPRGQSFLYSTDGGGDSIDTYLASFSDW